MHPPSAPIVFLRFAAVPLAQPSHFEATSLWFASAGSLSPPRLEAASTRALQAHPCYVSGQRKCKI